MKKKRTGIEKALLVTLWTDLVSGVHPSPLVCLPETVLGNPEVIGWPRGAYDPRSVVRWQPVACSPVSLPLFPLGNLQLT